MGADYIQFIPCLDPLEVPRGTCPYSLLPIDYGQFLCDLFDLWYGDWVRGNYHSIRLFDDYVRLMADQLVKPASHQGCASASTCATTGRCGGYYVIEADGSLYPCDFFTTDNWLLGNLHDCSLSALLSCKCQKQFLSCGSEKPMECRDCRWRRLCNGGCKNDWIFEPNGNKKSPTIIIVKLFATFFLRRKPA